MSVSRNSRYTIGSSTEHRNEKAIFPVRMHPDERRYEGAGGLAVELHGDAVDEEQRSVGAAQDDEVGVQRSVASHRGRQGHLLRRLPPQLAVPVHRVKERALQNNFCLLAASGFPLALRWRTSGTYDAA